MSDFIEIPIELNGEAMVEESYGDMEERFPGWEPAPGNLETWLIRAMLTRLVSPLAILAADVGAEIFYRFGEEVAKVAPISAIPASTSTAWVVKDTAGYTIPAGTIVNLATGGASSVAFRTVLDTVIPEGSAEAKGVVIEAVEPGTAGNELSGAATLIDALNFVTSIETEGATSGGLDDEDPSDYLGRLAETLQTMAPRPILAKDVAILARSVPGIGRAVALDNYNPATDVAEEPSTWDSEKATAVAVASASGLPLSAGVKATLEAELEAKRELNYIFSIIDPTYTEISVTFQVVAQAGFDLAEVQQAVISALAELLNPATWGQRSWEGRLDPSSWVNTRTLRYQDVVTVVNNAPGVDYYTELKVNGATADVLLAGAAPLVKAGTLKVGP